MHLSKLLALLPLASAVSGYIIPEGIPDGLYLVTFDENGNPTTEKVDPPAVSFRTRRGLDRGAGVENVNLDPLDKRDSNGATGRTLVNHNDYNGCTDSWYYFLADGGSVPSRSIFFCTIGQARLAGCNYRWESNWVPAQTVHQFNGIADNAFGWWKTGWVFSDAYQFTFWRDLVGAAICTNLP